MEEKEGRNVVVIISKMRKEASLITTDNNTNLWALARLFRGHFSGYIIPMQQNNNSSFHSRAYGLPSYGLLTKFPVPKVNFFLWS